MTSLGKRGQRAVRNASRQALLGNFISASMHLQHDRWIDANNRYRGNVTKQLRADNRSNTPVDDAALGEYIAASAPLHCADGWSFLGRALVCHSRGDGDAARHLAYYAELRAAISLLASEGIGVFNDLHYVVDASGQCRRLYGSGTHELAWQALDYWGSLPQSTDLLATVVSSAGVPLSDWLDDFGAPSSVRPIGGDWLRRWGLDLKYLSNDRDARNEASYRPTRLETTTSLDAPASAEFLRDLWNLHEPSAPSRFDVLDRHVLRLRLEQAHEATTGRKPADDRANFERRVKTTIDALSPGGLSDSGWKDFLTRASERDTPRLLLEAAGTAPVTDPRHHVQVISRATLLLRVSTGACARLLEDAGIGREDLEFWWKSLGEDRGLWEPGYEPDELTDLWLDVDAELENATRWEASSSGVASVARWIKEQARTLTVLGGCERIALWGMGL